ncbi:MAG: hypothetical protein ACLGI6_11505 [Gammaproteobacteria bacterium]
MRPADENQSHGKRPSLFASSTRPQTQDEQILARMERGGPRSAAAPATRRGRTALLGLGLLTVAALVSTLAILARQGGPAIKPAPEVLVSVQVPVLPELPAPATGPALLVEQAAPVQTVPLHVAAVKPAVKPAIKPVKIAARPAPKPAAKTVPAKPALRPRPTAAPADPAMDTDIAILAAVLSQSPRHAHPAEGPAELACQGKECRNKAR